jgi:carbamoyltransferase
MIILGISCFYHDSAACLIRDGVVVAAAQEERFSRVKNTSEFPIQAINFCVQQAEITFDDIDAVAYFEKPFLKFSRVMITHLAEFPFTYRSFLRNMPKWLDNRLSLPITIESELGFNKQVHFVKHHLSHAASAFFPSPFEQAAILTADGVGEWATFSRGTGKGNRIEISREIQYPDSLGLLYTAFTTFLGFDAHGGEGKTMALAALGEPTFLPKLKEIVSVQDDGSFRINQRYFAFSGESRLWKARFTDLFGPARTREMPLEQRHYDLAASIQKFVEDVMILNARLLQKDTGLKNLCLAGGVALNCVANHKILEETDFHDIFVQPATGDAGGSLGAALFLHHGLKGAARTAPLEHTYLGPSYSDREVYKALSRSGLKFEKQDEPALLRRTAERLQQNRVVGWFQGRMEFGPRALGNRSILGNPCDPGMRDFLNGQIKKRESFRPFAPIVLEERARDYFDLRAKSPYMLLAPRVLPGKREALPSITHFDGTARVQTVDHTSNPRFRKLLEEFERLAGVPILINTSFNRKGEPVVCKPEHAIDCFVATGMDCLAVGDYFVEREGLAHA